MNDKRSSGQPVSGNGASGPPRDAEHRSGLRARLRTLSGWLVLLIAVGVGFAFRQAVVRGVLSLIPPPRHGRVLYWVSPMDPTVRSDTPGKDSMGMEFLPVYAGEEPPPQPVTIAPQLQERDLTTVLVKKGPRVRTIRAISTVAYAEPLIGDVTLKVEAWLEKLYVDYEGQTVHKGDRLFEVYAPDLVAAQEEFLISLRALESARKSSNRSILESARDNLESVRVKLRYWDVSEEQIKRLEREKTVRKTITYYSRFTGIVTVKKAFAGKHIAPGELLYRIADLSRVWVYLYAYSNQIHCVHDDQKAVLTIPDYPARRFRGRVVYIYPYLEPKVRAVKVRLEFENPDLVLKPDMFGEVQLEPHHMGVGINIPRQAILNTGTRQLVYVLSPRNEIEAREITTGMELDGGLIEVRSGLRAGERIITSEEFLMDSESRLRIINRKFHPIAPMAMGKKTMQKPMSDMRKSDGSATPSSKPMRGASSRH